MQICGGGIASIVIKVFTGLKIRPLIEPVKCLMNGTILKGSPNEYRALNTSRSTLITDFYYFFLANCVT